MTMCLGKECRKQGKARESLAARGGPETRPASSLKPAMHHRHRGFGFFRGDCCKLNCTRYIFTNTTVYWYIIPDTYWTGIYCNTPSRCRRGIEHGSIDRDGVWLHWIAAVWAVVCTFVLLLIHTESQPEVSYASFTTAVVNLSLLEAVLLWLL